MRADQVAPALEVSIKRSSNLSIASIAGELDLAGAGLLLSHIEEATNGGVEGVVCDLGQLRFIDSTGLHAFSEIDELLRRKGLGFALVLPEQAQIRKVFRISGMDRLLPVYTEAGLALAAAKRSRASESS